MTVFPPDNRRVIQPFEQDFELNGDKIGLGSSVSYDDIALTGSNNTTLAYNGRDFAVLLGIDSDSLNSSHFA